MNNLPCLHHSKEQSIYSVNAVLYTWGNVLCELVSLELNTDVLDLQIPDNG